MASKTKAERERLKALPDCGIRFVRLHTKQFGRKWNYTTHGYDPKTHFLGDKYITYVEAVRRLGPGSWIRIRGTNHTWSHGDSPRLCDLQLQKVVNSLKEDIERSKLRVQHMEQALAEYEKGHVFVVDQSQIPSNPEDDKSFYEPKNKHKEPVKLVPISEALSLDWGLPPGTPYPEYDTAKDNPDNIDFRE